MGTVECGGCSAQLSVTVEQWKHVYRVPCPCGAWADLDHARNHSEWNEVIG